MKATAPTIRRRAALGLLIAPAIVSMQRAKAADGDSIYVGISGAYTGADSANSIATSNGAMMAIQEVNDRGGITGRKIETVALNEATANAGQYDPHRRQRMHASSSLILASWLLSVQIIVGPGKRWLRS